MNIFFEGLKNRKSTFSMIAYGFHNFKLSFCEGNPKLKFLLASMKLLTNSEIPSMVTLFRELATPAFI